MQFTKTIAVAALAATASAVAPVSQIPDGQIQATAVPTVYPSGSHVVPNATWTTQYVTEYVTDCPVPTSFTHGPSTYTVTKSTQITLPCPTTCAISSQVRPTVAPAAPVVPATHNNFTAPANRPAVVPAAPAAPVAPVAPSAAASAPAAAGTAPSTIPEEASAGNSLIAGSAAAIAAVVGAAALVL